MSKPRNTIAAPIRAAAHGQDCTLAIPGVCRGDTEHTVAAHLRLYSAAGMGHKPDDLFTIHACDACHAVQEDRGSWASHGLTVERVFLAFILTLRRLRDAGLITLKGETPCP